MKKLLFLFLICCLNVCYAQKHSKFDYIKSNQPWVDAFKDLVFFSSLRAAYKSDTTIFKLIETKDAFNPFDGLSLSAVMKAKQLGQKLIENMPSKPAMCENCKPGMNYYMATALHYYMSAELNSIAVSEYKKDMKSNNLYFSEPNIKNKKKRKH